MAMAPPPPPPPPPFTFTTCGSISTVHSDIIKTHILSRLDGATLSSFSCVSCHLYSLITSDDTLWTNICHSTWPSTDTPRLRRVISSFANGPRSFFSDSFTNPDDENDSSASLDLTYFLPSGLISAVDIHYQSKHVFSKVVQIKEFNSSSPFRVDLLDSVPVPTGILHPVNDDMYRELEEGLTLSWILIDPSGRRAMNLSSYKPVTVRRRWMSSSEVHARYSWVFSSEYVKCGISAMCEESESGEMQVSKVVLQLEDRNGKPMSGKDGLVILNKGMWGKRVKVKGREEEARRRYEEYMELNRKDRILKRERIEHRERTFDTFCQAFRVLMFVLLGIKSSIREDTTHLLQEL